MGKVGLLTAKDGEEVGGVLGFQVENLVARLTDDFLVLPDHFDDDARGAPLSRMEEMARDVQGEAAILLASPDAPPDIRAFQQSFGHKVREIASLPSAWQEATRDFHLCGRDKHMVKRLRADHATRPFSQASAQMSPAMTCPGLCLPPPARRAAVARASAIRPSEVTTCLP